MTPNEISMLIASRYDKQFDDPFKFMCMKRVDIWRERLIRNSLEKEPKDRKFFRQTLYMKTRAVAETVCGITGCDIVETIDKLPMTVRANNIMYDFVGAVNATTPYRQVYSGTLEYAMQEEFNKTPLFMEENGRIKIYRAKPPIIRVDAIFPDPQKIAELSCKSGMNCDYWDTDYPCTGDILQTAIQGIYEVDLKDDGVPSDKQIPVVNNPREDK